jgi:hypothetical protein
MRIIMLTEELRAEAERRSKLGQDLYLTLAGDYPKGFPRGELMCVNSDNHRVYLVSSEKVLKWCEKQEQGC